ncbi:MAG: GEVED domain-containing protein [Chryseobacterium artocarpi]
MKKIFTSFFFLCLFTMFHAQWAQTVFNEKGLRNDIHPKGYYTLDISLLKSQLAKAEESGTNAKPVTISIPTLSGKIERFAVYSFPVIVKELADQYQLGSYAGVGIDDPSKYIRFSLAPNDFQSMIISNEGSEFIEPGNANKTIYEVHPKTQGGKSGFICSTEESFHDKREIEGLRQNGQVFNHQPNSFARSSDRKYRTLRLAISVTGEYTQFFGGTVAGALTGINATLTRVNGIYEKDFALHLVLQNFPNVIYTNPSTDPYSSVTGGQAPDAWNTELQQTLTANVGDTNYDIGHLFGASGGGGNAGCIGCICLEPGNPDPGTGKGKGSGFTSPANSGPQGDVFDIDFVAHEMGHQLGGNHTFSYQFQIPNTQFEPGSGSTIMGYAGIANGNAGNFGIFPSPGGTFDIQPNTDPYFINNTIKQVQSTLITRTCDIETTVANNPPVIAALPIYNIPKGTAFALTASVTDAENDPMTYAWEQADAMISNGPSIDNINLGNTTTGASFRSLTPSASPTRYFPKLSSVLAGVLHDNNGWEAVSTVARTTKFSITVRDNNPVASQQQTQSAFQTIIVGNNGPFKVNPTTVYNNGPTTVTWDVAATNASPYNTTNVKIDFTSDNGLTWYVLAASTANDGTESLDFSAFPLPTGGTAKIRVSAINNVFYAIGNASIDTLPVCVLTPPGGILVTALTQSTATVTWNASYNASYLVQYRVAGAASWINVNPNPTSNSVTINGLSAGTTYEVQIANICSGVTGSFSPIKTFTTPYCSAVSSNTDGGYISNVTVAAASSYTMSNNSGANNYTDYSSDVTKLITLVRGTTGNTISVSKSWSGAMANKAISVWIDFNKNGAFETNERILNVGNNQTTPVSGNFAVPATAYAGPLGTKMRVVMRDLNNPGACGTFTNGEVEDYAVKIIDLQACNSSAPSNVTITNITPNTATVSWVASTGATYILRYRKVGTTAWTTIDPVGGAGNNYTIPNLEEQTQYEVQVATNCNNTLGVFYPLQQFTTPAVSYCSMIGTGTNDHISNVMVTPINPALPIMTNNSVQNNYTNYTTSATLITLEIGSTNNKISVAKGWTGSSQNDAITAWIDFNRDGQFINSERILISAAGTNTPVTGTFNVPANAYSGPLTTVMRVALRRGNAPTMCQNTVDGEVEDYVVKLKPCSIDTPTGLVVNTITHNSATLNWTAATNNLTSLVQYRIVGTNVWTDVYVSDVSYILNNLLPNTTYEVQITANCGITLGTPTAIKTFTTRCDPTPPNVTVSSITPTTALITWSPLAASSTYTLRWRKVGVTGWPNADIALPASPANTYVLGSVVPLEPYTTYEVMIANQCNGDPDLNPFSNPKVFTTERICQIAPPGLTITQLLPTMAEIKWDPFPGATYVLRYRKVGIPSWTEVPTPVNTVILNGLTEMTKYEMQVVNICSGTPGNYTPPYYFTTPTVIYCKMASGSSTGEHISKVTVIPNGKPKMENASGASTYTDYTGVPATFIELIQGSTDNEIIIDKKWTGNTYNEGVSVWIDFNRNGEFDINEKIFTSSPNTDSPVSGKFNVPSDAFVSMTDYKYVVMRVAMERDGVPVSCTNFNNGEVEDYTVRISKKGVPNPLDQTDIMIYPNPVSSILYVKNISKKAKYKIYNAAGQVIGEGILLNNQINVSRLINGVYVIDIDDNGNTVQKKFIKE